MSDLEKFDVPQRHRQIANPVPLGMFSFASTVLVLSLFNVHARHVSVPNVVVGMAIFYGGLAQFMAGMWAFAVGNTFCATAFSSYGAFWVSLATLYIPGSGIADAYQANPGMEEDAIGIFLLAWTILTVFFFIGSLRKSVLLSFTFFLLIATNLILAIGFLYHKVGIIKIGGYFGIVTSIFAYYCGLAEMLTPDDIFTLPTGKYNTP